MTINGPLHEISARIVSFYRINGKELQDNYIRVASQNNFSKPSDNITDFFRAEKARRNKGDYKQVRQNINEAFTMMNVADQAGTQVYNDLTRMKELVNSYYDSSTSNTEKEIIEAEFNSLKTLVTQTITNTYYNGKQLIQDTSATDPLQSINIDPTSTQTTFDIDFTSNDVADVSALDITVGQAGALAAVQSEYDKAGSYLAKTSGYLQGLTAQLNLVDKKISSQDEITDNLSGLDSGKEMAQLVARQVNQKSSMAMLSQANMERRKIMILFR